MEFNTSAHPCNNHNNNQNSRCDDQIHYLDDCLQNFSAELDTHFFDVVQKVADAVDPGHHHNLYPKDEKETWTAPPVKQGEQENARVTAKGQTCKEEKLESLKFMIHAEIYPYPK